MDPFQLLSRGGIRFDRKKHLAGKHEGRFKGSSAASGGGSSGGGGLDSAKPAPALDFFNDASDVAKAPDQDASASKAARKRKRKLAPGGQDESATSAGVVAKSVEETALFRKAKRIFVKGSDVPQPIAAFADLRAHGVKHSLVKVVEERYPTPTAIQAQVVPVMLANREVFAIAPTGSGKTLGFALPILATLKGPEAKGFRAVVLSPTRELAAQIKREFDLIAPASRIQVRLLDKSNASSKSFHESSSQKFDVLISTPMRLQHSLEQALLTLKNVEWLVMDEADRLFENGFETQVDEIIAACTHPKRRIGLFSATMPERVEELARTVLHDPVKIQIGQRHAATADIDQELVFVGREDGKLVAIRQLVQAGLKPPVLIFVQSKTRAIELFNELVYDGINVDVIHAERTKQQRDNVVKQFRAGRVWVMIATDLMARGLDFKGVNMVINYDFPANAVDYIHRIGRTGRAGRKGKAITLFTQDDGPSLRSIANVIKSSGCDVPQWMLELRTKRKGRTRVIQRESISTDLGGSSVKGGKKRKKPHSKRPSASS